MKRSLVIMAKPPTPGLAKTRLAAAIGPEDAAMIAYGMLADTLELCEAAAQADDEDLELVLAYTAARELFRSMTPQQWRLIEQRGEGLDERMDNVLADISPSVDDLTMFIGSDSPHMPEERISEAFAALDRADVVLGPCEDGGYYLIGVRGTWPAGALAEVRWSGEHALADTREALTAHGLACVEIGEWYDVDEIEDLRRLAADAEKMPPGRLENTWTALMRVKLD